MGSNPQQTVREIEEARDDLARKVDLLVDQAKIEAVSAGKKIAIVAVALVGLVLVGSFAKRRVRD
ncbi:MAG TPA: DUF3618 domain-containing protein [Actinomycetota bacterium]|nr:DUF3618 domain-containing protein [Actinomycetota bacterium]